MSVEAVDRGLYPLGGGSIASLLFNEGQAPTVAKCITCGGQCLTSSLCSLKTPLLRELSWESHEPIAEDAVLDAHVVSAFQRGLVDRYTFKSILLRSAKNDPKGVLNALKLLSREEDKLAVIVAVLCDAPLEAICFLETHTSFISPQCNSILEKHINDTLIHNRLDWRDHYHVSEMPLMYWAKQIDQQLREDKLAFGTVELFRRQLELFGDSLNLPKLFVVIDVLGRLPLHERRYRHIRHRCYVLRKQLMNQDRLIYLANQLDIQVLEELRTVNLPLALVQRILITHFPFFPEAVLKYLGEIKTERISLALWIGVFKQEPWIALKAHQRTYQHKKLQKIFDKRVEFVYHASVDSVVEYATHAPNEVLEHLQDFVQLTDQDMLDVLKFIGRKMPGVLLEKMYMWGIVKRHRTKKAKYEYMLSLQDTDLVFKSEQTAFRYLQVMSSVKKSSNFVELRDFHMPGHIKAKVLSKRFGLSHLVDDRSLSFMDLADTGITDDRILHQGICYAWALMVITQDARRINPVLVEASARFYQAWLVVAHNDFLAKREGSESHESKLLPKRLLDRIGLNLVKKSSTYLLEDLKSPGILYATFEHELIDLQYDGIVLIMNGEESSHAIYIHPQTWTLMDQNCRDQNNDPKVIHFGNARSFYEGIFYHLQTRSDVYFAMYLEAYRKKRLRSPLSKE